MSDDAFSAAQLAQLESTVRKAVREELADAGLRLDGPDHVDDARRDFMFLRSMRRAVSGAAAKIGLLVIAGFFSFFIYLVNSGMNWWKGN